MLTEPMVPQNDRRNGPWSDQGERSGSGREAVASHYVPGLTNFGDWNQSQFPVVLSC